MWVGAGSGTARRHDPRAPRRPRPAPHERRPAAPRPQDAVRGGVRPPPPTPSATWTTSSRSKRASSYRRRRRSSGYSSRTPPPNAALMLLGTCIVVVVHHPRANIRMTRFSESLYGQDGQRSLEGVDGIPRASSLASHLLSFRIKEHDIKKKCNLSDASKLVINLSFTDFSLICMHGEI